MTLKLAVVGSGLMAHIRTRAFMATKDIEVVGVASWSLANAKKFACQFNVGCYTSDFKELDKVQPDVLLVEVPHHVQAEVVHWALEQKIHLLIGSSMAMSLDELGHIQEQANKHDLIVEAGFEARYKAVWRQTRKIIEDQALGDICAIQSTACWKAKTDSWYYSQLQSGGMPITHMTYAFINPLNWIFGRPNSVSALANKKGKERDGMVDETTCLVQMEYKNNIPCQLLASYVAHDQAPNWRIFIQGTSGSLEVFPGEFDQGSLIHYDGIDSHKYSFEDSSNPFETQCLNFVSGVRNKENLLLNSPKDCWQDMETIEGINESILTKRNVVLRVELFKDQ